MSGVAVITEVSIGTRDRACVDVCPAQCIDEFEPTNDLQASEVEAWAGDQSAFADLDDQIAPHVFAIMTLLGTAPDPVRATEQALLEIRPTAPRYSPREGSIRAWGLNIADQQALRLPWRWASTGDSR